MEKITRTTDSQIKKVQEQIQKLLHSTENPSEKYEIINKLNTTISKNSPVKHNPISLVQWIPSNKIRANDYNPNEVAHNEMKLLYKSIDKDGYTQPVVTVYNPKNNTYEIVDGAHRFLVMKKYLKIRKRSHNHLPITVINKSMKDRMASTIRHNRARGKHSINGKAEVVTQLLKKGWPDAKICEELGMEKEELSKLKHTTGFSKLFDKTEYQYAWKATKQLEIEKKQGTIELKKAGI